MEGLYPENPESPYYEEPDNYYDNQGYYDQGGGFGALQWHYLENPTDESLQFEKQADPY